ncbi:MAG: hypothetical protein HC936_15080 [Leptolyngbyaceae cyanobacterium SU_3_3]|nr:hypothetical protein [Leptolyngbyaceae cyanobacterium SU_3_3]NJR49385.1 hypothetical protein [Leptolyngbyaceae cyanobacterium CSU_1_3]
MIHHISIAAKQPLHVAEVIAELCQGQAFPFPAYEGSYIALNFDPHGTMVEVLPQGTELIPGETFRMSPMQAPTLTYSAFHAAISVPISEEQVHAIAQREGWHVKTCDREGYFSVIEVWIENQQLLEFLPSTFAAQYRSFMQPDMLEQFVTAGATA